MKLFFALILLILLDHSPAAAQASGEVKWFKGIFQKGNRSTAEKDIEIRKNQKLIAIESNDFQGEIRILMETGAIYLTRLRNREDAMKNFIESLKVEDSLRLDHEKIFTLLGIARVFEEVDDYSSSVEYIEQASGLSDAQEDLDIRILILEESARIQTERKDTEAAMEKYEQILQYAKQLESKQQQGDAMFNLGKLYMYTKDYEKALSFHRSSLGLRRSLKDKTSEVLSLHAFAEVYLLMNNADRAMANELVALDINRNLKDSAGMALTYNRIAKINIRNKDYPRAIANLKLGLAAAQKTQQQEEIRRSYDQLSISYKELKDYNTALQYRESFLSIDEFIRNEDNSLHLSDTRNRYTLFQKEKEIDQLESGRKERDKVIQEQKSFQIILFALVVVVLVVAGLVAYLYYVKRRLANSLKIVNDAKDKLFSIIGHDIKGPLNSLTAFLSLLRHHGDNITKEEIKLISTDLDKSLKNLFSLLENLLQWARTQTGNIDFKAEPFNIAKTLNENVQLLQGQASVKSITLVSEYDATLMANGNVNSISTVIRNLLSNAIKFTPKGGKITLSAQATKEHILVSVADNGVGIDPQSSQKLFKLGTKHSTLGTAQEKGTGLGLLLCKEFVEKNGGMIGVTSKVGEGSRFYFTVPVN
ncbi:hypothetical protein BH10BAC4_BH10BAC4_03160 [soil metagenome]